MLVITFDASPPGASQPVTFAVAVEVIKEVKSVKAIQAAAAPVMTVLMNKIEEPRNLNLDEKMLIKFFTFCLFQGDSAYLFSN